MNEEAADTQEFDRFHDLARKLTRMPEHEIDAERDREASGEEAERGKGHQ